MNTLIARSIKYQIKQAEEDLKTYEGNPEHLQFWIDYLKNRLKQERKQPPETVAKFLPEEA